jgi:Trk K+ transport system NAD-binding subunit
MDAVVVMSDDDHVSLRIALVVEGVRPGVRLIVTVYDRDVAAQLERAVGNVRVMSMPDIVAPTLAGPCFDDRLLSVSRTPEGFAGVEGGDDGPRLVSIEPYCRSPAQRLLVNLGSVLRPFELSARTLLAGMLGFLLILVLDTVAMVIVLDQSLVDGFYAATKTIVTVGPNSLIEDGPGWFKVFSALVMLAALGFTAIFTAGVVNRLLEPRLVAIAGRGSFPRRDHVVVVGLGQVGLRLCILLRELGVPVVAIERDPEGDYVARAKQHGVPVVIGQGGSRFLLGRLSLERARALAAVTSDEIENIAIVVGALGVREDLPTLLRAGGGDVVNETRSLFSIGVVRDVRRIGGTMLAAAALGLQAREAFLHEQVVYLIGPDGRIEAFDGDVRMTRGMGRDP